MTSSSYDWIAYGQGFASGILALVSTVSSYYLNISQFFFLQGYIGYLATKYIQKKKRDVMLVDLVSFPNYLQNFCTRSDM